MSYTLYSSFLFYNQYRIFYMCNQINSSSSSLKSVDCIFQFFGEGPQFAVVEEHTCNICIESSDFYVVADFSAVKNFIQCFESIHCKNFSTFDVIFRV